MSAPWARISTTIIGPWHHAGLAVEHGFMLITSQWQALSWVNQQKIGKYSRLNIMIVNYL